MTSRGVFNDVRNVIPTTSEGYLMRFGTSLDHVLDVSQPRPERIETTFWTYHNHVRNVSRPRPERIETTFWTYHNHVRNVSQPRPERIPTTSERITGMQIRSRRDSIRMLHLRPQLNRIRNA